MDNIFREIQNEYFGIFLRKLKKYKILCYLD